MEPTIVIVEATYMPTPRSIAFESLIAISNLTDATTTLNANCRDAMDATVDIVLLLPPGSTSYLSDSLLTLPSDSSSTGSHRQLQAGEAASGDSVDKVSLACHVATGFSLSLFPQFIDDPSSLFRELRANLSETVANGRFIAEFRYQLLLRGESIGKIVTIMNGNLTSVNLHIYNSPVAAPTAAIQSDSASSQSSAQVSPVIISVGIVAGMIVIVGLFFVYWRQYSSSKFPDWLSEKSISGLFSRTDSFRSKVLRAFSSETTIDILPDVQHTVGDKKLTFVFGENPEMRWICGPKTSEKDLMVTLSLYKKYSFKEDFWMSRPRRRDSFQLADKSANNNHNNMSETGENNGSCYGEFDYEDTFKLNNIDLTGLNSNRPPLSNQILSTVLEENESESESATTSYSHSHSSSVFHQDNALCNSVTRSDSQLSKMPNEETVFAHIGERKDSIHVDSNPVGRVKNSRSDSSRDAEFTHFLGRRNSSIFATSFGDWMHRAKNNNNENNVDKNNNDGKSGEKDAQAVDWNVFEGDCDRELLSMEVPRLDGNLTPPRVGKGNLPSRRPAEASVDIAMKERGIKTLNLT